MRLLAIDPGAVHNGLAYFELYPQEHKLTRWWTRDLSPEALTDFLEQTVTQFDVVVVEEFRLYPELAREQGYSDFPTVEMIGVIKYLCKRANVKVVMQGASIKRKSRRIGERTGFPGKVRSLGAGRNRYTGWDYQAPSQHERDATAHGAWHVFTNESSPAYAQEESYQFVLSS